MLFKLQDSLPAYILLIQQIRITLEALPTYFTFQLDVTFLQDIMKEIATVSK